MNGTTQWVMVLSLITPEIVVRFTSILAVMLVCSKYFVKYNDSNFSLAKKLSIISLAIMVICIKLIVEI